MNHCQSFAEYIPDWSCILCFWLARILGIIDAFNFRLSGGGGVQHGGQARHLHQLLGHPRHQLPKPQPGTQSPTSQARTQSPWSHYNILMPRDKGLKSKGRRAQHSRRGRRAPGRPRQGCRAPGATTTSRCPGTRAWKARRRRAPPGTQSPKVGSGESLKSVFKNPMVGTIYSLVSSDVTNLQPTSGSGNLSPTLGEEVCAPLWCKISVLLHS